MRQKKFLKWLFWPSSLLFLVSCGTTTNNITNNTSSSITNGATKNTELNHNYFLSPQIQNGNHKILELDNILYSDLKKLPLDSVAYFNSSYLVGGFGEPRHFYNGNDDSINYHAGLDVMVAQNTRVVAPADGKIIASYWVRYNSGQIAQGIGGVVVMEVNIADLNLSESIKSQFFKDQEKLILTFMHLSQATPSNFGTVTTLKSTSYTTILNINIDPQHPFAIKKAQTLGYVGEPNDNGGWPPHVHLEVHNENSNLFKRLNSYRVVGIANSKLSSSVWARLKPVGTVVQTSVEHQGDWATYQNSKGYVDPNIIYQLYSDNTPKVKFNLP